jgi:hypothetical protein
MLSEITVAVPFQLCPTATGDTVRCTHTKMTTTKPNNAKPHRLSPGIWQPVKYLDTKQTHLVDFAAKKHARTFTDYDTPLFEYGSSISSCHHFGKCIEEINQTTILGLKNVKYKKRLQKSRGLVKVYLC